MNEIICIKEVGVDLELCVHAHGHDVDPIMEASCKMIVQLYDSFGILELIPYSYGSDHAVLI